MAKKLAVINTVSCSAKARIGISAKTLAEKIKKALSADVAFTEYAGHAQRIARDASGYNVIIAAGGDGTVSEVVNGMDLQKQALAILPIGTGNSLMRDLGIKSLRRAFNVINRERIIKIDIIRCKFRVGESEMERYAITTSGMGYASGVVHFGNEHLKRVGLLSYFLPGLFLPFGQEIISASLIIDDLPLREVKFTNCFVNNTSHSANWHVFPNASLDDCRLNILFARTNALTQWLWNLSLFTRTYFYYPGPMTADKVCIILHKPSRLMLDGEIFDSVREIKYSVISQGLNVFT